MNLDMNCMCNQCRSTLTRLELVSEQSVRPLPGVTFLYYIPHICTIPKPRKLHSLCPSLKPAKNDEPMPRWSCHTQSPHGHDHTGARPAKLQRANALALWPPAAATDPARPFSSWGARSATTGTSSA